MKYQDYAFTLRKTTVKKVKPTTKTYADHIDRIFRKNGMAVVDYAFEDEGGLHCHGCVELKDPYIKNQKKLRIRGWRLHLTPIFDMKGWVSYYNKNKQMIDKVFDCGDVTYVPSDTDEELFGEYMDSIRGETLEIPKQSMFQ